MLLERCKLVVEPAGSAAVAALLAGVAHAEPPVVAVLSGGNIDPLLMVKVIEHGLAAAGRYLRFTVRCVDRPGQLAELLTEIAAQGANVDDVEHQRHDPRLRLGEVEVSLSVETRGAEHSDRLLTSLRNSGYTVTMSGTSGSYRVALTESARRSRIRGCAAPVCRRIPRRDHQQSPLPTRARNAATHSSPNAAPCRGVASANGTSTRSNPSGVSARLSWRLAGPADVPAGVPDERAPVRGTARGCADTAVVLGRGCVRDGHVADHAGVRDRARSARASTSRSTPRSCFLGSSAALLVLIAIALRPRFGKLDQRAHQLSRAEAPELLRLIDEVAAAIGVKPPHVVLAGSRNDGLRPRVRHPAPAGARHRHADVGIARTAAAGRAARPRARPFRQRRCREQAAQRRWRSPLLAACRHDRPAARRRTPGAAGVDHDGCRASYAGDGPGRHHRDGVAIHPARRVLRRRAGGLGRWQPGRDRADGRALLAEGMGPWCEPRRSERRRLGRRRSVRAGELAAASPAASAGHA